MPITGYEFIRRIARRCDKKYDLHIKVISVYRLLSMKRIIVFVLDLAAQMTEGEIYRSTEMWASSPAAIA